MAPNSLMHNVPADSKYHLLYNIEGSSGHNNSGISVVQCLTTKKILLRKTLHLGRDSEIAILRRLQPHPTIMQFYDYTPSALYQYRIPDQVYLEFCDRGTLLDVVKRYNTLPISIPEAFIWHVFESLASALQFLHNGKTPGRHQESAAVEEDEWDPIIHYDIHLSNVFLSTIKTPNCNLIYPRIVLGDFGNSISESEMGHQQWQVDPDPQMTDVQYLGATIESLATGCEEVEPDVLWVYSRQLNVVMTECLQDDVGFRPDAERLMVMTQKGKRLLKGQIAEEEMLI